MPHRTVLVTGANGFLARRLIVHLLGKDYAVRGTVRQAATGDALKERLREHAPVDQLTFVIADLLSDAGWAEAVKGVDAVFHMASPFPSSNVVFRSRLIKPAVEGSLRVLKAAKDAGVHRVIVTSSAVAIAYGHGSTTRVQPFNETHWTNLKAAGLGAYHESKTRAELAVWDFAMKNPDMQITAINPGVVFGPVLDSDFNTSASIIVNLFGGKYPGLPHIGFECVDVRDVADLHERVLDNERSIGHRYVCTAGFLWLRDMAQNLRETYPDLGNKIPKNDLPDVLVRLAAIFDRKTSLAVPELGLYWPCSSARATQELGWQPRPAVEAVHATADSLIEKGLTG